MTATVTLELPESILVEALRRLPPARRHQLWISLEADGMGPERDFPSGDAGRMKTFDRALGLLATGQTAPTDAEIAQLLEERRAEKYG